MVEAEEQTLPPAVYMCEYKGLAQIFVLMAEAKADILREDYKVASSPAFPGSYTQEKHIARISF